MFSFIAILTAALCCFFAFVFFKGEEKFEKIPRSRIGGLILGVPALIWSAWHGCIMLEGSLAKFHPIVWALVPITAVLAYLFMDYLFARAAGGFLVLAANQLIAFAFRYDVPARPLYSLVCLAIGICGLFMLGTPWRVRDAISLSRNKRAAGMSFAAVLAIFACIITILSFVHRA